MHSLLFDMSRENALLIYKNRLFEMAEAPGNIVWQWNNVSKGFAESESLTALETITLQPLFEEKTRKKAEEFNKRKEELMRNAAKTGQLTPLDEFLIHFLAGGKKGKIESIKEQLYDNKAAPAITEFNRDLKFHDKVDEMSILDFHLKQRKIQGVMIVKDTYLELTDGTENGFGYINIHNSRQALKYGGKTQELCGNYAQDVERIMEGKISTEESKHAKEIIAAAVKANRSVDTIGEIEGRGFVRRHGNVYIYMKRPFFQITGHKCTPVVTLGFPSCKIGLEISHKYNTFYFETPTRIIEAKKISRGREYGDFEDMWGKDYMHPATRQESNYVWLCIKGTDYEYPSSPISDMEEFRKTVTDILNKAVGNIETGYWTKDSYGNLGTATVYRHLKKDLSEFQNNIIR